MKRHYREGSSSSAQKSSSAKTWGYNVNELHRIGSAFRARFHRRLYNNGHLHKVFQKIKGSPCRLRFLGTETNPSILDVGGNSCPSPQVAWRSVPSNLFESFEQNSSLNVSHSIVHSSSDSRLNVSHSEPLIKRSRANLHVPPDPPIIIEKIYKCDFCSFVTQESQPMIEHLTLVNHFCSSAYQCLPRESASTSDLPSSSTPKSFQSVDDFSDKLLALCVPRALINSQFAHRSGSLTVLCPNCYFPFPDPFLCAYHHQIHHNRVGRYLIVPVTHCVTSSVVATASWPSKQLQCCKCTQSIGVKAITLTKHWLKSPTCSPFSDIILGEMTGLDNVVLIANCPFCKITTFRHCNSNLKSIFAFFIAFHQHIAVQHPTEEQGGRATPRRVIMPHVLIIRLPQHSLKPQIMAPLSQRSTDEVFSYCARQAQILQRHLKAFILVSKKQFIRRIKEELKMLSRNAK